MVASAFDFFAYSKFKSTFCYNHASLNDAKFTSYKFCSCSYNIENLVKRYYIHHESLCCFMVYFVQRSPLNLLFFTNKNGNSRFLHVNHIIHCHNYVTIILFKGRPLLHNLDQTIPCSFKQK